MPLFFYHTPDQCQPISCKYAANLTKFFLQNASHNEKAARLKTRADFFSLARQQIGRQVGADHAPAPPAPRGQAREIQTPGPDAVLHAVLAHIVAADADGFRIEIKSLDGRMPSSVLNRSR